MSSAEKTPRNLLPRALTPLPQDDPVEAAHVLFRQAEQNALATIDWYLWKKTVKSRWSRILRAGAIILAVGGGVVPLVHAARPSLIAAEWGYVVLAVSAGCVLFDRYFGFTSSWMRYMRAQARLHRVLVLAQADWATASLRAKDGQAVEDVLIPIIREFIRDIAETVEGETDEWAIELTNQSEQLHNRTGTDRSRPSP